MRLVRAVLVVVSCIAKKQHAASRITHLTWLSWRSGSKMTSHGTIRTKQAVLDRSFVNTGKQPTSWSSERLQRMFAPIEQQSKPNVSYRADEAGSKVKQCRSADRNEGADSIVK